MNILSYDIEEWYIENVFRGGRNSKYQLYDDYLNSILDVLDAKKLKATFFCVGRIAVDFPYVVKKIAERGHEIGCHSNEHLWLTKMTPQQLKQDTQDAISSLQDVSGQKIISYRAPAFSIGESNKWAIEILAECGIEHDSSIFPAVRDFGGFATFPAYTPVLIDYNGIRIKEFPINLTHFCGKEFAFSGGGYFRFFPLWYIKNKIQQNDYSILYFHIGDLIHNTDRMMTKSEYEIYFRENGSFVNRYKRYVKSHLGTKGAYTKMTKLLDSSSFVNIHDAALQIDWDTAPVVKL